ncbi:hypothetical protein [Pontibacter burrus]|uniref:Fibronectin type-III domain-containing protein n=1 Tax=Pontibacter burrus TaxID=2704466 RepID=A0A6B3LN15_9BACT|nr:hypothetical protein [Pontibacter burrus]NEM97283.1 hypothetical protein [Pontibacter burrus]
MKSLLFVSALFFCLMLTCNYSFGQVLNDKIENRIELILDTDPFNSNTTNCTVDKACINEALEGNCVKFHNDQWFWFKTAEAGTYYLNVSGQDCRDILGVQLMVIDGVPCQTETYKLISCVSLASQDDIYLQLDSLKSNYSYLLNVDGYLHDFCDFNIQFSSEPKGLPAKTIAEDNKLVSSFANGVIQLNWVAAAHEAQTIVNYQVLKRTAAEQRFTQKEQLPFVRDTYSQPVLNYSIQDSISSPGTYHYKVIAQHQDDSQSQVGEYSVTIRPDQLPRKSTQNHISLQLNYREGTPLSIYVLHPFSKQILKTTQLTYSKKNPSIMVATSHFRKLNLTQIEIKITNHKTGQSTSRLYNLP